MPRKPDRPTSDQPNTPTNKLFDAPSISKLSSNNGPTNFNVSVLSNTIFTTDRINPTIPRELQVFATGSLNEFNRLTQARMLKLPLKHNPVNNGMSMMEKIRLTEEIFDAHIKALPPPVLAEYEAKRRNNYEKNLTKLSATDLETWGEPIGNAYKVVPLPPLLPPRGTVQDNFDWTFESERQGTFGKYVEDLGKILVPVVPTPENENEKTSPRMYEQWVQDTVL